MSFASLPLGVAFSSLTAASISFVVLNSILLNRLNACYEEKLQREERDSTEALKEILRAEDREPCLLTAYRTLSAPGKE